MELIRLLLAGLIVLAVMLVCGVGLGQLGLPQFIVVPGTLLAMGLTLLAVLVLFNRSGIPILAFESNEKIITRLEEQGLLVDEEFEARRAFLVDEYDDEGVHYFVELVDESVLFLSGQYLYDYTVPGLAGSETTTTFPATAFTVRRHKAEHYVVEIVSNGVPLLPEIRALPFTASDYRDGQLPEDGDVVTDKTYDELKAERLRSGATKT